MTRGMRLSDPSPSRPAQPLVRTCLRPSCRDARGRSPLRARPSMLPPWPLLLFSARLARHVRAPHSSRRPPAELRFGLSRPVGGDPNSRGPPPLRGGTGRTIPLWRERRMRHRNSRARGGLILTGFRDCARTREPLGSRGRRGTGGESGERHSGGPAAHPQVEPRCMEPAERCAGRFQMAAPRLASGEDGGAPRERRTSECGARSAASVGSAAGRGAARDPRHGQRISWGRRMREGKVAGAASVSGGAGRGGRGRGRRSRAPWGGRRDGTSRPGSGSPTRCGCR